MSTNYNDFNRALIHDLRAHGKATGGPFAGRKVLVLTTKGARSGETRENPLVYTEDGERLVIVASKGGAPTNPAWYHNLRRHPVVTVETNGEKFRASAKVVEGAEYDRLFKHHADTNPGFWDYTRRTTRKLRSSWSALGGNTPRKPE